MSASDSAGGEQVGRAGASTWSRYRLVLLALIALVAALHVGYLLRETRSSGGLAAIRFPDERNAYLFCAERFAEQGWAFVETEDSLRSPPMPWMWLSVWGRNIALARFANIGLIIIGSLLISTIARERFGDRLGLVAFVACACGYQMVHYAGTVLTEPLAVFFVCLLLWALHRLSVGGAMRYALLEGLATGLAALSRPSLQLFPIAFLMAWWAARRIETRRRGGRPFPISVRHLIAMAAVFGGIVGPWVVKNHRALRVTGIANGFGAVLYLGSELRTNGDDPTFSAMDWPNHPITAPYSHLQIEGDRRLKKAGVDNIRRHPLAWAGLCVRRVGRFLVGGPDWHFFPAKDYLGARRIRGEPQTAILFAWWTVGGTFMTVFGLAGLWWMRRRHRMMAFGGLALIGCLVCLHGVVYATPRFGLPLYPALVLGSCGFLAARPRRRHWIVLTAVCIAIPAWIAFHHRFRPAHVVPASKVEYFTVDRAWVMPAGSELPFTVDGGGRVPEFNTCLFVRATIDPIGSSDDLRLGVMAARTNGAESFDEDAALVFPVIADGREHTYQVAVGLQSAWRGQRWDALRFTVRPAGSSAVRELEIRQAH